VLIIRSPIGDVAVRTDRPSEITRSLSRNARTTPAGLMVLEGDGGWDPATLTLRFRVADPSDPLAVRAWRRTLRIAREATSLQLHDSELPVLGLQAADSQPRGTWWDVTLRFLPAALRGARPPDYTPVIVDFSDPDLSGLAVLIL